MAEDEGRGRPCCVRCFLFQLVALGLAALPCRVREGTVYAALMLTVWATYVYVTSSRPPSVRWVGLASWFLVTGREVDAEHGGLPFISCGGCHLDTLGPRQKARRESWTSRKPVTRV